uniref:Uncharacterized protein n=1 Tax=Oryza brachyantha TaxID=4533 RepID=J3N3Q4_ORYBR
MSGLLLQHNCRLIDAVVARRTGVNKRNYKSLASLGGVGQPEAGSDQTTSIELPRDISLYIQYEPFDI